VPKTLPDEQRGNWLKKVSIKVWKSRGTKPKMSPKKVIRLFKSSHTRRELSPEKKPEKLDERTFDDSKQARKEQRDNLVNEFNEAKDPASENSPKNKQRGLDGRDLIVAWDRHYRSSRGKVAYDDKLVREKAQAHHICEWLSSINFREREIRALERMAKGTQWIFDNPIFKHWLEGETKILWCSGLRMNRFSLYILTDSWYGEDCSRVVFKACNTWLKYRSIVVNFLDIKFKDDRNSIVACVYLQHDRQTITATECLLNIMKQIVEEKDTISPQLSVFYDKWRRGGLCPILEDAAEG